MNMISKLIKLLCSPFVWMAAVIKKDRFVIKYPKVIQIIGIPGSGKTISAVTLMKRSIECKHSLYFNANVFSTEDSGLKFGKIIDKEILCSYRFKRSIILWDESSLNGFDSREWQANFRGSNRIALYQFKLHRHYDNSIITTSQSANDNDSKIRDGVAAITYITRRISKNKIRAYKATVWYAFDDGKYHLHMDFPSLFQMITDPYSFYTISIKKYGSLYDTKAKVSALECLDLFPNTP